MVNIKVNNMHVFLRNQSLVFPQPSQPLSCILNLSYPRVSILPEVEEFLVMFDGDVISWARG
jgi:hypothetical protein